MYREVNFLAYENGTNCYSIDLKEQLPKYQQDDKHFNKIYMVKDWKNLD